jgi:hypothetical protein
VSTGQIFGTVLALLSSPLASYSWPLVFHLSGVAGLVWCLFALWFGASDPESHRHAD